MLITSFKNRSLLLIFCLFIGLGGFLSAQNDSLPLTDPGIGGSTDLAHPSCENTPRFILRDSESARFVLQYNGQLAHVVRRLTNVLINKAQFKANRICAQNNCINGDCVARKINQEIKVFTRRKVIHGQTIVYVTVQGKFWFKCGCS